MHKILIDGEWFTDEKKRKVIFRGSNVSCKLPNSVDPISFTGIPFPIEEAKEHFQRLRYWGFNCLRYTVTWESVEHEGPGIYDYRFLHYLSQILEEACNQGLYVFIDFHQDVWSRFTGGCGAPAWTLEKAGFNINALETTGAALLPKMNQNSMNHLLWVTNAFKLATATMFTLFFGGHIFAPKLLVEGENIQFFLQRHYMNAMKEVAKTVKHLPNIIGFDIMNEPLRGYIQWKDLRQYEGFLSLDFAPTPFQSMLLGMGESQVVEFWKKTPFGIKRTGLRLFDPEKQKAWKTNCIWREHGVWDFNNKNDPVLLIPDYFLYYQNRRVRFSEDFYRPFIRSVSETIRTIQPETIIFIENEIHRKPPVWGVQDPTNIVFSTHWYDGYVLALKKFSSFLAVDGLKKKWLIALPKWMRRFFAMQVSRLQSFARERIGRVPTMITEFGIAFDMHEKKAYRTGNFSKQVKALHRSFLAIEDNMLSCTIWNYFAGHSKEQGDHWNNEDLSIYSADQDGNKDDPYYGARAKDALIRPYPVYTPGIPQSMYFDIKRKAFHFTYLSDDKAEGPLEIFLPHLHFQGELEVTVSNGTFRLDLENQRFYYTHNKQNVIHIISIKNIKS